MQHGARAFMILLSVGLAVSAGCRNDKSRRPPALATPSLTAAEVGDRHYLLGEYSEAVIAYETALAEDEGPAALPVIFRLAMSYMGLKPGPDGQAEALELLRRETATDLSNEAPLPAAVLLQLLEALEGVRARLGSSQREVQRLTGELEKLRAIDLQRRPPGR